MKLPLPGYEIHLEAIEQELMSIKLFTRDFTVPQGSGVKIKDQRFDFTFQGLDSHCIHHVESF